MRLAGSWSDIDERGFAEALTVLRKKWMIQE